MNNYLEDNSYLEEDIAVLGLSNRTQNSLKRNNINTLGDLTKHTWFSLLRLKGIGDESVKEIIVRCVAFKIPLGSGLWRTTKKRKKVVEDDEYKNYIVNSIEMGAL